MPELPVSLRDGMEVYLRGNPTVEWLLSVVNDESRLMIERTGAFMCLVQAGVKIKVGKE